MKIRFFGRIAGTMGLLGAAFLLPAGGLEAQELLVRMLQGAPEVDGRLTEGEYPAQRELERMLVGAGYWDGTLYICLQGETQGWVAGGFGTSRMHGAYMAIGFVGPGGAPTFREQEGENHRHRDTGENKVKAYALSEEGGKTTLELALPLEEWKGEAGRIPMTMALGSRDSLVSMHSWYSSLFLKIQEPRKEY